MSEKHLDVRLNGASVATLTQDASGRLSLRYGPEATQSLSLCLPLQPEPHLSGPCEAFFGGLLPESEAARKSIAARFGANANSTFSLLRAIGRECAGAVSLHEPDGMAKHTEVKRPELRVLDDRELAQHIRELPQRPLFLGVGDLRLSLAGAQEKAAVCLVKGQLALPLDDTPTTHILKPAIDRLPDSVQNEFLCMSLAKAVGLAVPVVEQRMVEGLPYLLVERYDRHQQPNGQVTRIHQEDFCQALGVSSKQKYESDGGPTLEDCFTLASRLGNPGVSRLDLLRRVLLNVLIGNCDAHAKNYSILHPTTGRSSLAPVYDVLSTRFYPELSDKLAMKIGGYYRVEDIWVRRWKRFCEQTGLGFPLLRRTLFELNGRLQGAIAIQQTKPLDDASERLLAFVAQHAASVVERFQAQEAAEAMKQAR